MCVLACLSAVDVCLLSCPPPYFLRQVFSLNPEPANSASVVDRQSWQSVCLPPQCWDYSLSMGAGELSADPRAPVESSLLIEPPPSPTGFPHRLWLCWIAAVTKAWEESPSGADMNILFSKVLQCSGSKEHSVQSQLSVNFWALEDSHLLSI